MVQSSSIEAFKRFLSQFPNYSEASFALIEGQIKEAELKADDLFLRQGDVSRKIAFIVKGLFRISYLHDGKEVTTCFCKENSLSCSYQSLITQEPSTSSIQAIEDCVILTMNHEILNDLYAKDSFWQQIGRIAAEGEYLVTAEHTRFINDLSATERYLKFMANDKELFQRIPLNFLASYLQVAPETLSRIRQKTAHT